VAYPDEHGALPAIPNERNGKEPWPWDESTREAYRQRDRVERSFAEAEQYRRLATRHETLREVLLGLVRPVSGFLHIGTIARSVNRP
jgi:transposase